MVRWKAVGAWGVATLAVAPLAIPRPAPADPGADALALMKSRCVRCHGPARQEGGLNLAIPAAILRGGKSGPAVFRGKAEKSRLWQRIAANAMPPDEPLPAAEKKALRRWIDTGAPGLPAHITPRPSGDEHWAFQKPRLPALPAVRNGSRVRTPIDRFVQAKLESVGLTLGPEADRASLIRRVSYDVTGLPPTAEEIEAFRNDRSPGAYERMVDRYLASPHFGERWGKYWLDAAGYADSNGYFSADTDRPLAYRYRDYVVRSLNAGKPWDRFLQEQIAGDELADYHAGGEVTPSMIDLLEATHFLRNSQDGTDSSDGNPDERRADKYAVLEGTEQIFGSSLFGLTVQCARCHDHKFEPFTQHDYYQLQAVLYPAFNIEKWTFPKNREVVAATAAELASWDAASKKIDAQIAQKRAELAEWSRQNRETGRVLFEDNFDAPGETVAANWSNTAPGDPSPAGQPALLLDSPTAPGAQILDHALQIHESGSAGDRALCTRRAFSWVPRRNGGWVQATFDLVKSGDPAPYVAYFLALGDFDNRTGRRGGNVLLDGAMAGQAAVHVRYPGPQSSVRGSIGKSGYVPGRNYGVRVTNRGSGKLELTQVVDGVPEEGAVPVTAEDLPDGAFGFEYCCGRSYRVDNVRIEEGDPAATDQSALAETRRKKRAELDAGVKQLESQRPPKPGRIALVNDPSSQLPEVPLLQRGDYKIPKEHVPAAAPVVLSELDNPSLLDGRTPEVKQSTGRRLAFARWLTQPNSRAAGLLARVTVNRWWSHLFGTGIVATPENLGYSGAPPSHPELLDWLAGSFAVGAGGQGPGAGGQNSTVGARNVSNSNSNSKSKPSASRVAFRQADAPPKVGGLGERLSPAPATAWSQKALLRLILVSQVYRQVSRVPAGAERRDPEDRLLSRFPLRRLDAESIRDAMLSVSGELDAQAGGPYVPTSHDSEGDVVVVESTPGSHRRSLYLQQKRTQVAGLLEVFDTPSIVVNCTGRTPTTVPLQSLKLLNSEFVRARAAGLAHRLHKEAGEDRRARLSLAFTLVRSRVPGAAELAGAERFLTAQAAEYAGKPDSDERAWTDFCQALLASNDFLYLE